MFRPTGFADLAGRRVGIFGYGVEGRAAAERLRDVADLVLVDDADDVGPDVLVSGRGGHEALLTCDVVLKSPGIPRHRLDVLDLEDHNVAVCSALNLWLHDIDRSRVVAITGTKGKSTTTALLTFFLEGLGEHAQRLGNFGQPPYALDIDTSAGWLVLEVSSFQCVDIDLAPGLIMVTSIGSDHLDWHGTLAKYRDDKLSLTRTEGWHHTLVPDSEIFHESRHQLGGEVTFVPADLHHLATALGLLGVHSDSNVALALEAAARLTDRSLDDIRATVTPHASQFVALRGRLTVVGRHGVGPSTVTYVDDGLATSPLPVIAALNVFQNDPLALIVGGFDRGVDYDALGQTLCLRTPPTLLLTMGAAGQRIGASVRHYAPSIQQVAVASMDQAVREGRAYLIDGGVVLLSPGAPSFDRYMNWEERSSDFERAVYELTK